MNSSLLVVDFMWRIRNWKASSGFISARWLRSTNIRCSTSRSSRRSSRRVLDFVKSMLGYIRLLARKRSSCSSILPVPLNSSKITWSILEPVSIRAVARMVSEPPPSMLRAAPKNFLGFCRALASTPPERILPELGCTVLYARARRVIESSRMQTSWPDSTMRLAFSSTTLATRTWLVAGSSKVELTTSAFTLRFMSVTSSGRSSTSSTMR